MTNAHLLLLSSSRAKQTDYLSHAKEMIKAHLGDIKELLFIPYAGITISYDQYTEMVQTALADLDIKVTGIHSYDNAAAAVESAQAVAVGGGNTFHLLHQLYQHELLEVIREKVNTGMPYIGWSAGSNVAGLSIRTTNDMPIIEPPSFTALNLVNFQLNPHFTDYNPPGHNGETRSQRLAEFMVVDKQTPIVAIVEGTALKLSQGKLCLIGPEPGFIFQGGEKSDITQDDDLTQLLG
ncbi:dipeptidase PepE [Thalassomonas haliotis]|uniref:Dipeptidase PepE n=1 Tax=Thalassomonas haliotis TaxID=485448 RepID=A0ABY7VLY8_9GAMM|nr:dipeptidase PepE [Thalassomonas haliotis]WDE14244.1 dipeptidase PepE [Thalassomonas haliotis]